MIFFGGLSRKAPSNARGDDPFLGGFFFIFFRPPRWGRSPKAAPGLGFSLDLSGGKPTFLFCGNLLSLDRENDCARSFIFTGWCVPSGSRSDRAGPGLGRGMWGCMIHSYVIGRGNTATAYLQAGMIRPVPDATADAVVDVQGGSGRRVPRTPKVSYFACTFCRWQNVSDRKNEERSRLDGEKTTQRPIAEGQGSAENLLGGN